MSLSAVTVALVTGSAGPAATHVLVGPDAGVSRYPDSYVNCTDLHSVDKARLRRRLGRLAPVEVRRVEIGIRTTLGL
ncbi:MAG TPA: type II toxin-antitoxin system PemK/MazF family toxin [Nakamurella sp.]